VVLLWTAWCAAHSALIAATVTRWVRDRLPTAIRCYRLGYNVISALSLAGVIYHSHSVRAEPVMAWEGPWRGLQVMLVGGAALLFVGGAWRYDALQWIGLRQLSARSSAGGLTATGALDTAGVLGFVRHPWYTATFALLWARSLSVVDLLVNLVLTVYLVVGTRLEERKLTDEFGDAYRQYQRRVSMYLPFKWVAARAAVLFGR
jgi:protein-S-isoprenylcysteine O-methyltransferase Ste14